MILPFLYLWNSKIPIPCSLQKNGVAKKGMNGTTNNNLLTVLSLNVLDIFGPAAMRGGVFSQYYFHATAKIMPTAADATA